uniref:ATP receptor n=1 Tax=Daphnia galeata TaxID=27404 RepID=A0A8J2WE36_9CRUS|nr:unnamed protein product [Daphnia galeata]
MDLHISFPSLYQVSTDKDHWFDMSIRDLTWATDATKLATLPPIFGGLICLSCPLVGTDRPLLEETADFTVLIKNFIEFPMFGKTFRRRNMMEDANKTYLQTCNFNQERDPFCPVFRIGDIVHFAGENFTQLAVRGGVIVISIDWNCNLDWDFLEFCKPMYSFRRVDNPNTNIAPGWNFRHANYHEENRRTLFKSYGIRFVIEVRGQGAKFNILPTMLNIASGLALLGVTTVVCDFIILYFTESGMFYKEVKFLLVDDDPEKRMGMMARRM